MPDRPPYSDQALAAMLAAGGVAKRDALEYLFEQYYQKLLLYLCGSYRLQEHEAEDVIEDVFVNLLRRNKLFDPTRGTLPGWLYKTTGNCLIDSVRKRKCRGQAVSVDSAIARLHGHDLSEEHRLLLIDLDALDEGDRELLCAKYMLGFTDGELAKLHEVSEGAIALRVRKARHVLRARFTAQPAATPVGRAITD